jgi:diguanylate cyclase (GGDEF)-like protein
MELRSLLQILAARWWLVVPVFVITLGASVVFALSQRPVYEASAKLVVSPAASLPNDIQSGVALLSRQPELVETYAQIASSDSIQTSAADSLKMSRDQRRDTKLTSHPLTGTLLIELTVDGTDPTLARDYANAISRELTDYVRTSSGIFQVSAVDQAGIPGQPVSPNVPLDVALGAIIGLLLGTGLAIVVHLLNPPAQGGLRDVVDPETWAFNGAFLAYRLRQEMSRARRSHQPVSLALVDVNHQGALNDLLPRQRIEALRRIVSLIDGHLRSEDVSARVEGTIFGVLLPDTSEEQAMPLIEALRARIAAPALASSGDGVAVHANMAAGVVEFVDGPLTDDDVTQQARVALQAAQTGPIGRTEVFSWLRGRQSGMMQARPLSATPMAALPAVSAPPNPVRAPMASPRVAPTAPQPPPALRPGSVTRLDTAPALVAPSEAEPGREAPPAPQREAPAPQREAPVPEAPAVAATVASVAPTTADAPPPSPTPTPAAATAPTRATAPAPAPVPAAARVLVPPAPRAAEAPNLAPASTDAAAPSAGDAATPPSAPSPLTAAPADEEVPLESEPKSAKPPGRAAASAQTPLGSRAPEKVKRAVGNRASGKRQVRRAR